MSMSMSKALVPIPSDKRLLMAHIYQFEGKHTIRRYYIFKHYYWPYFPKAPFRDMAWVSSFDNVEALKLTSNSQKLLNVIESSL